MNSEIEEQISRLTQAFAQTAEELDKASEEDTPIEDIEGAKTLASELVGKYELFLTGLTQEEKAVIMNKMGPSLKKVKESLMKLKEAPE